MIGIKIASYLVKDLAKGKGRSHIPNRAFRMSFPILKYMALKTEPVTAYRLEAEKLDVMRDGKTQKASIDKPTIFAALKLLERTGLIKTTDRKVCKDDRVRKKYVVTPQGIVALLQAHPGHVEISKQYVRDLARNRSPFFPSSLASGTTSASNRSRTKRSSCSYGRHSHRHLI